MSETASEASALPLKRGLRALARGLGFQLFGVARAESLGEDVARLGEWLGRGEAARMSSYLGREYEQRGDPLRLVDGARSVVTVGMSYGQVPPDCEGVAGKPEGRVARFALGPDYHEVLRPRLNEMAEYIARNASAPVVSRAFVDTGPLLERAFARRAGLGFIGKNACLIHPRYGSWFVLGAIVTSVALPADRPVSGDLCGECRRCLDACPTGALYAPRRLDARRCLSYLTIETRESLAPDTMRRMGNTLFGCDACQEVCPFNNDSLPCEEPGLTSGSRSERFPEWDATLERILGIRSNREFDAMFSGTALLRSRRSGLLRNAAIAAGNLRRLDLRDALRSIVRRGNESRAAREAAAWALEEMKDAQYSEKRGERL
ncbi:tRNA epoxyqueuosine(34) reductase QueG [Candidatus Sumerlaeota bacterium]|nr:tRNA epoxyqueuosine(34) reductase QueG [Candidatus Sumerlaeota bacterium]